MTSALTSWWVRNPSLSDETVLQMWFLSSNLGSRSAPLARLIISTYASFSAHSVLGTSSWSQQNACKAAPPKLFQKSSISTRCAARLDSSLKWGYSNISAVCIANLRCFMLTYCVFTYSKCLNSLQHKFSLYLYKVFFVGENVLCLKIYVSCGHGQPPNILCHRHIIAMLINRRPSVIGWALAFLQMAIYG